VNFALVYIQEAHATDGWQLPINVRQGVLFADPRSIGERADVANACVRQLKLDIPAVLDDAANSTERNFTGWPDRLYVLQKGGRVLYKSAPGPFGFKLQDFEKSVRAAAR
jgi:type I thyroxine 5'-deiodinase